ncbi:hypothetical protein DNL43_05935 [Lentilactobacillus kefiri]|uniref:hypothetical protein n=1 Tax=Lentilactobacillus kefiri TaxID=33962 RepID=UPI0012E81F13|nr:hypothetical protein [Lentilactobacillus kefiri]QGV24831.1 hypothetical protein DNL43_05935 [Lentilactobacillus kefiri]
MHKAIANVLKMTLGLGMVFCFSGNPIHASDTSNISVDANQSIRKTDHVANGYLAGLRNCLRSLKAPQ